MLEINNLTFSYGRKKQNLFENLSFRLERGKVYGLLGKNGSGKSTLLYLMCGLLRARKGSVLFEGRDVSLRLPSVLEDMYIVPEEFALPAVSLRRFVELNAPFYPRFSNEILDRCLRDFEMERDLRLDELSMGQKKKAFMSFALATNTSLLLMDEPTNGFDIPSKSQMRKVIASNMSEGKTIVISTHQVRDVENLLDHLLLVDSGRMLLDAGFADISRRLYFCEQPLGEPTDGAVYVQPSLHGNSVVYPNRTDEESTVNLESLFNALLADSERLGRIIGGETDEDEA